MEKKKIKFRGFLNSLNTNRADVVDAKITAPVDEVQNVIQVLNTINRDIKMVCIDQDTKGKYKLGTFSYNNLNFDNDADSTIKLKAVKQLVNYEDYTKMSGHIEYKFVLSYNADPDDEEEVDED